MRLVSLVLGVQVRQRNAAGAVGRPVLLSSNGATSTLRADTAPTHAVVVDPAGARDELAAAGARGGTCSVSWLDKTRSVQTLIKWAPVELETPSPSSGTLHPELDPRDGEVAVAVAVEASRERAR